MGASIFIFWGPFENDGVVAKSKRVIFGLNGGFYGKRLIFVLIGGVAKRKRVIFRLNGRFAKRKRVIFA